MSKQNYSNHRSHYVLHHFVFYPIALLLITVSLYFARNYPENKIEWYMISAVIFMVTWVSFMMRQHYALIPQDRIIRLEMRLRYFQLYGKRFEPIEAKLKFGQIAALRFASDEELPVLLERAVEENLSPNTIKKLITDWQPDHMRV